MNILAVGPLVVLALCRFPHTAALLLPACAVGLPVVAYNLYFFGTFSGGYGTQPFDISSLGYGIAGLTVSPARGLFLYFPIAAVALALAIKRRVWAADDISRAALIAVVASVFFYGTYKHWHGGGWVGPRYLSEVQPLLLILLGLAWPPKARVLSLACFGVLLPYCIFIQAVGTYTDGPLRWNHDHGSGGWGVLWKFRDNPIAYAFRKTGHHD
jgi:hypothetical protein